MSAFDVAVIGAGPAGAIAATLLARRGKHVVMFDPDDRAAERIGETLPSFAAQVLKRHDLPGPLSDDRHKTISGAVSLWGGLRKVDDALGRPGGPDWRLDRAAFDTALMREAIAAGATLKPKKVEAIRRDGERWSINGSQVTAGVAIDASGRRGVLSRQLGGKVRHHNRQVAIWASGAAFPDATDPTCRTLIEDQGQGWWYGAVLPSRRPVAAYHCDADHAVAIRKDPDLWHQALSQTQVLAEQLGAEPFKRAKLQFTDASGVACETPAGPGWAACGDAAMAFDPLASQGLLNAIRTGIAAAEIAVGDMSATDYCAEMGSVWRHYLDRHAMMSARREMSLAM